jgi:hypothetical protein
MNARVYSAMRKTTVRVARERATPSVIDPAIKAIVTIKAWYRHDLHTPSAAGQNEVRGLL